MKKMTLIIALLLIGLVCSCISVGAEEENDETSIDEIYSSQLEESGALELADELPQDARKNLDDLNITSPDWRRLNSLSFFEIMGKIISIAGQESITPLNSLSKVLAVILLCALLEGFKTTFSSGPLGGVLGTVSTLCICGLIAYPITETIVRSANIISLSANFALAFIPVMAGVMITSGQAVSGASYYAMMMAAGTAVSQIASRVLVPMLNVFLGISLVGAISPKINLNGVCELIHKVVKWVLTFIMSVFVTLLTMQTVLGSAADSTGTKAARFAISSFVPLVGGALSEAFQTVQSCLKLLKSGIGVFAILGTAVIYLPVIIQCIMWLVTINVCAAAGDVFGLSTPCSLLRASGKVISTMLAILLCCMVIFIISSAIILMVGGSG